MQVRYLPQNGDFAVFELKQEQKKMPEAIQYIEKACMMYMENGTPDTAAMALDRAGK